MLPEAVRGVWERGASFRNPCFVLKESADWSQLFTPRWSPPSLGAIPGCTVPGFTKCFSVLRKGLIYPRPPWNSRMWPEMTLNSRSVFIPLVDQLMGGSYVV